MADAINAGERSDRLVVRWDLDREPGPRTPPDDARRRVARAPRVRRAAWPSRTWRPRSRERDRVADRAGGRVRRAARRASRSTGTRGVPLRAGAGGVRVTTRPRGRAPARRRCRSCGRSGRRSGPPPRRSASSPGSRPTHAEGWGECVADDRYPGFSGGVQRGRLARCCATSSCRRSLRAGDVTVDELDRVFGVRAGQPDGQGDARRRVPRRRAPRARRVARRLPRRRRDRVACGVSVGITPTTDELRAAGRRVPGRGLPADQAEDRARPRRRARRRRSARRIPEIPLSVDANAAYTLEDADVFRALDAYDLLMVEQPLHHEDLVQHAALQRVHHDRPVPRRVDPLGGATLAPRSSSARAGS